MGLPIVDSLNERMWGFRHGVGITYDSDEAETDKEAADTIQALYGWMERVLGDLSNITEEQAEALQQEGVELLKLARGESA